MKKISIHSCCKETFLLRDVLQWGKKRPGNYLIVNNFGEKEVYHKKCYRLSNPYKPFKKIRIGGGYNALGQSLNAEIEIDF